MARSLAALLLGLLALGAAAIAPAVVGAQDGVNVIADEARNEFPAGVSFRLTFDAASQPAEVRLRYEVAPDGTGATGVASCAGSRPYNCTYTLASGRGIFIIPGAEITYHWEIEDDSGSRTSTEEKLYVHEDTRFTFRTVSAGNVTVHYHSGTQAQAEAVLAAATETLEAIGGLTQTQVSFPVKVYLYQTADEMQPAIVPGGGRGVQVLGEVVYSDTAMVSADVATLDITRHEVAHIVTREATKGPFDIPGWLNEGISVYAQRAPLAGHADALEAAIRGDRVLSMKELNSSATGGVASTVGLYYGQAGAIVGFLVDTYGAEKFAELIRTFKDGATPDNAFETAYGFDQLGIENEWRASVGLSPRAESATPTPAATEQASGQPQSGDDGDADAASSGGGDGVAGDALTSALIAVLAAAALGAGAYAVSVARRRL